MVSISIIEYFRYSRYIKRQAAQIESNREKTSEKKENAQISIDSLSLLHAHASIPRD